MTATFHSPQLTIFSSDIERLQEFYERLGFAQQLRYPAEGKPQQIELTLDGLTLRLSDRQSIVTDTGLTGDLGGHGAAVSVWCADIVAAHNRLTQGGVTSLVLPRDWQGGLRTAWVADPDGNPVQLIQPAPTAPAPSPTAAPTAPTSATEATGHEQPAAEPTEAPAAPPQTSAAPAPATPGAPASSGHPVTEPSDDDLPLPQSPLPAGYYTEDGTPTFDAVAERIHQRAATAEGNEVLDGESQRGRDETDELSRLKQAGQDRLAQLRKSMGFDS